MAFECPHCGFGTMTFRGRICDACHRVAPEGRWPLDTPTVANVEQLKRQIAERVEFRFTDIGCLDAARQGGPRGEIHMVAIAKPGYVRVDVTRFDMEHADLGQALCLPKHLEISATTAPVDGGLWEDVEATFGAHIASLYVHRGRIIARYTWGD